MATMSLANDPLVDALVASLGEAKVRTDPVELGLFHGDASTFEEGAAGVVCVPTTAEEVTRIVALCAAHKRPFVARGGGTGLAGGAVPCGDRPVVIALSKLDAVLEVNVDGRYALVEPGVINLDLTRHLGQFGFHFAPDPSSQQASTIGGNLANNAGGPHCLAYGVTNAHILAAELVLPSGEVVTVGGLGNDPVGYDLRGVVVGGEGMLGVVTKVAVRITPNPKALATMLAAFDDVSDAARAVSSIIAGGLVPAAIEMMDRNAVRMVEDFIHAGYPRDAEAVLLVEVDGEPGSVADAEALVAHICHEHNASSVRTASDDAERDLLWRGRKAAFGAVARIKPNYYLHDTVVPRGKLVEVLQRVYEIAEEQDLIVLNVFHAGDGNLHPIFAYDRRTPGVMERVHAAGDALIKASLAVGGVLSGEHGIGLEKQGYMSLLFSDEQLAQQGLLREVFDPDGISNPMKVIPTGASCGDIQHLAATPKGAWL